MARNESQDLQQKVLRALEMIEPNAKEAILQELRPKPRTSDCDNSFNEDKEEQHIANLEYAYRALRGFTYH